LFKNYPVNNFFLLLILSAIWGSAFFAIKVGLNSFSPIGVASLRLIIASIFLLFLFYLQKKIIIFTKEVLLLLVVIGIIGNFIPFYLISWAEQFIPSSTAGMLMAIGPIITLVMSHFLTKSEKFSLMKFISISIGLLGVFFIFNLNSFDNLLISNPIDIIAKLLVIIAAFGYMLSNIIAYEKLNHIDSFSITTFATTFGAIFSLPFFIFDITFNNFDYDFNYNSAYAIIYLGIFPTAIAFQFRYYITKTSGPVFLSYVAYLIPAFAVIWGYILLSEKIGLNSLIGIILILFGVYLGQNRLVRKIPEKDV
tara:strand:+ start:1799 stop:2725 length:927 start_codon:yes stop_codon:yes gene_type:complete